SSILSLLGPRTAGRWHRVDADEVWVHVAGGRLELRQWTERAAHVGCTVLGVGLDEAPQDTVAAHVWQQAVTGDAWAFVSCVVTPGFNDQGFEMAPDGWAPPIS
ncbi:MAG: cupin domain-containing protein, partial [Actinomycetes bacterium]